MLLLLTCHVAIAVVQGHFKVVQCYVDSTREKPALILTWHAALCHHTLHGQQKLVVNGRDAAFVALREQLPMCSVW